MYQTVSALEEMMELQIKIYLLVSQYSKGHSTTFA